MKKLFILFLFLSTQCNANETLYCEQGAEISELIAKFRDHFISRDDVTKFIFLITQQNEKVLVDEIYSSLLSSREIKNSFQCGK